MSFLPKNFILFPAVLERVLIKLPYAGFHPISLKGDLKYSSIFEKPISIIILVVNIFRTKKG